MSIFTGWIEKRQSERVDASIKVTYSILPKEELVRVLSEPNYRESSADHLPALSKKSAIIHAVTRDISLTGMSLVGKESFTEESALEIQLYLPGYPVPLTLLAEVLRVQSESSSINGDTCRAGIKILAINRTDVIRLDKYLWAEKIRQRTEK